MKAYVWRGRDGVWCWGPPVGPSIARPADSWRDAFDAAFAEVTRRRGLDSEAPC